MSNFAQNRLYMNESFADRLTEHLLRVCTSSGLLDGKLLASPDIDGAWTEYAPSYYGDAVRNFNDYPEYCLACAGYLGMAVARLWDEDWQVFSGVGYSFFQGGRGFDDMDDHITGSILKDGGSSVPAMETCSTEAYHFLMKERPEPGTAEAYRMFLAAAGVLFRVGAAIELHRLGYKLEKVG